MVKRFKSGSLKLTKNSDPDKYKYNDLGLVLVQSSHLKIKAYENSYYF